MHSLPLGLLRSILVLAYDRNRNLKTEETDSLDELQKDNSTQTEHIILQVAS